MLTDAQLTICRRQLESIKCPVCGGRKDSFHALCRGCYFALPDDYRPGLWVKRTDTSSMTEWTEFFVAAKDWLRRMRSQSA